MKGGATGSGKAQLVPADDINLHFTGDIHAVTSAHNLLSAMVDNHMFHGNVLRLNPGRIVWKRVMDMNDRSLRHIVTGLGSGNGHAREAIIAAQIGAVDAMIVLLKEAIKPNLVQTIEGTPVMIHGGPFANIAHGCSSLIGTRLALKLAKLVVTEAGFGADLGAEKFFDIKCRQSGLSPVAAVLVITVKALKYNGGVPNHELNLSNTDALMLGLSNMDRHIENLRKFGVPVMVAINHYADDISGEVDLVKERCCQLGVPVEVSNVWAEGSEGGKKLAEKLVELLNHQKAHFVPLYEDELDIRSKIERAVKEIYRLGYGNLSVCMAKTPYSFSDQPRLLGAPKGFNIHVTDISLSAGAGFVVVQTDNIMTMPGLPKTPAAEHIALDEQGIIHGLF
ncbi:formate--tetrahydrofolate ligase [Paenibacillus crassostreae]|uniref:Formate--tetrahydrofolate ligase n=1 Tax=Paenibacillus crassostreae TaxID=1763538 RepID=A0A162KSN5_9BACL|nr:formate--tetrahydrofolate ligase [Paenibacillus crassostreae]OAB71755.1 formate--tetrahydrofolate ligase [Paenibacillus crassostreae]